jgi:DNA-binding CsgD family transcriptional regulator
MRSVVDTLKKLNALPVSAAILDPSGIIVAVNDAWKSFGRRNGLRIPNSGIGSNYLQYCGSGKAKSSALARDLKAMLAGKLDLLTLVYPCDSPSEKRWFSLVGVPLSPGKQSGVALLHVNLTDALPVSIGVDAMRNPERIRQRSRANAETLSSAIERSVSESLTSQLDIMVSGPHSRSRKENASADSDRSLPHAGLSKRQMQVLRLLGEGKSNKEIAEALFRSPNTIKLHVSAILRQLKLKTRTQAALLASDLYQRRSIDLAVPSSKQARDASENLLPARK